MDNDFKKQMEYVGIPAWHAKGIKGKGLTRCFAMTYRKKIITDMSK